MAPKATYLLKFLLNIAFQMVKPFKILNAVGRVNTQICVAIQRAVVHLK